MGIPSIQTSTIGKVIKRNHFFFQKSGKIYHHPGSKWAQNAVKKKKRLRVRYAPQPKELGYLELDSVTQFVDGLRRYILSAIDVKAKFSFSLAYQNLNSENGEDFLKKLMMVYPLKVKAIQTDNGLEFQGLFDQSLKKESIPHYFTYPRCPKINGVVERYQRSLQEEFVNHHLYLLHDLQTFNQKMVEYLIFYNTKRVHQSIGLKSPMDYLILEGLMSKKCVTRTQIWLIF